MWLMKPSRDGLQQEGYVNKQHSCSVIPILEPQEENYDSEVNGVHVSILMGSCILDKRYENSTGTFLEME